MRTFKAAILVVAVICIPSLSMAQFVGEEEGSAGSLTTVKAIKEAAKVNAGGLGGLLDTAIRAEKVDDRQFVVEGRLTKKIERNVYVFEDKTGRMAVEIDNRDFRGQHVSPKNTIRIMGEAEYSELGVGLEVYRLDVIK